MALSKPLDVKSKRFADISEEDLVFKHAKVQRKNTKKGELSAQRQFQEYLQETGSASTEFWLFEPLELDLHLSKFWFAARQDKADPTTGERKKYKVQSLKTLRYGLKRFLFEKGHNYDITKSDQFRKSQLTFQDACRELKDEGLGFITPTEEITPSGN